MIGSTSGFGDSAFKVNDSVRGLGRLLGSRLRVSSWHLGLRASGTGLNSGVWGFRALGLGLASSNILRDFFGLGWV